MVPTSTEALTPGLRDGVAAALLADATQAPLGREADVFAFFRRRCELDTRVATLTLQLQASLERGAGVGVGVGAVAVDLPAGSVVEVSGLASADEYNGCVGVILATLAGGNDNGHYHVSLSASMKAVFVRRQNLILLGPELGWADIEREVLSLGADAIDALARLAVLPACATAAKSLLALATEQWAVWQWERLVGDAHRVDLLEEGGLVVSQWAEPGGADVSEVRATLAQLADAVLARVSKDAPLRERVEAVSSVMFDEWGFAGNTEDYYDPRNSFLHSVLARRRGIPISLSIVWVSVARRVEVPCFLCAQMPAHILIRVETGGHQLMEDLYVDAFGRNVMDYEHLLRFTSDLGMNFQAEFVAQRPATAVYARLLRNLIAIFQKSVVGRGAANSASDLKTLRGLCAQAIVVADPHSAGELQQLGQLQERVRSALYDAAGRQRQ